MCITKLLLTVAFEFEMWTVLTLHIDHLLGGVQYFLSLTTLTLVQDIKEFKVMWEQPGGSIPWSVTGSRKAFSRPRNSGVPGDS